MKEKTKSANEKAEAALRPKAPWREPPELQRYIPRPVELSTGGRVLQAIAGLLIAGALALGIGLEIRRDRDAARLAALERRGVTVGAEVIRSGRAGEDRRQCFVVYRYTVQGRIHRGRQMLWRDGGCPAAIGSLVRVRYLPDEPARSWMSGYEPRGGAPLLVVLGGPAVLTLIAWLLWYLLLSQRRLLETGRVAAARVVGVRKVHNKDSTTYKVEYEFQVLSGAWRRTVLSVPRKPPDSGTVGTLLYNPENDRRVALYPLSLVRVSRSG